jgi:hypothetical protein
LISCEDKQVLHEKVISAEIGQGFCRVIEKRINRISEIMDTKSLGCGQMPLEKLKRLRKRLEKAATSEEELTTEEVLCLRRQLNDAIVRTLRENRGRGFSNM